MSCHEFLYISFFLWEKYSGHIWISLF